MAVAFQQKLLHALAVPSMLTPETDDLAFWHSA